MDFGKRSTLFMSDAALFVWVGFRNQIYENLRFGIKYWTHNCQVLVHFQHRIPNDASACTRQRHEQLHSAKRVRISVSRSHHNNTPRIIISNDIQSPRSTNACGNLDEQLNYWCTPVEYTQQMCPTTRPITSIYYRIVVLYMSINTG